eukprot:TRINITY_DN1188_c0_g1_i2.p1 TRINITY_DN1188_c0_g1~~TRINITY_DN1188_c0_g1_i2.p1  ORF type:complete len:351 (-),score=74.20 TRINITY_DN1188_c0_g1_i2:107-1159(-)
MVLQVFVTPRELTEVERKLVKEWRQSKQNEFQQMLIDFQNSAETVLEFPATLTSQQRSVIHNIAEDLNLGHDSTGRGASRHIVITKRSSQPSSASTSRSPPPQSKVTTSSSPSSSSSSPTSSHSRNYPTSPSHHSTASPSKTPSPSTPKSPSGDISEISALFHSLSIEHPKAPIADPDTTVVEFVYYKGYIGFAGDLIDTIALSESIFGLHSSPHPAAARAKSMFELVPAEYRTRRCDRDGSPRHHITLITKMELEMLRNDRQHEETLRQLATQVQDDWRDLGLGRVVSGNEEAFFRLVDWPSAQRFRKELGLPPKDFHITIGFKTNDIHSIPKNAGTLVFNEPAQSWSH